MPTVGQLAQRADVVVVSLPDGPASGQMAGEWRRFATQDPGADFTRGYPFVAGDAGA